MNGQLGKSYLKNYFEKTDSLFEEYLLRKISEAGEISKIPMGLLKSFLETARRGKKIRGALTVLGYEAMGGKDINSVLDTSLFIELFHAGVLVHDDFMDEDDIRRGLPTIHLQMKEIGSALRVNTTPLHYGESMAVSVGDVAFYLSWEKLMSGNFPPEYLVEAGKIYTDYIVRVVHGQVLDITNTSMHNLTEDDVLKVLKYKSAEYTGVLPLLIGATLAGEKNKEKMKAIYEYGLAFGWAFQIQDDTLGLYGKEEEIGKPIGSDLREGKNTLFMLHLSKHGTPEEKAFQHKILGNKNLTKSDNDKMCEILKARGSYDYVINLGWNYVEEGKKHIEKITKDKHLQEILDSLITYMMERTK